MKLYLSFLDWLITVLAALEWVPPTMADPLALGILTSRPICQLPSTYIYTHWWWIKWVYPIMGFLFLLVVLYIWLIFLYIISLIIKCLIYQLLFSVVVVIIIVVVVIVVDVVLEVVAVLVVAVVLHLSGCCSQTTRWSRRQCWTTSCDTDARDASPPQLRAASESGPPWKG